MLLGTILHAVRHPRRALPDPRQLLDDEIILTKNRDTVARELQRIDAEIALHLDTAAPGSDVHAAALCIATLVEKKDSYEALHEHLTHHIRALSHLRMLTDHTAAYHSLGAGALRGRYNPATVEQHLISQQQSIEESNASATELLDILPPAEYRAATDVIDFEEILETVIAVHQGTIEPADARHRIGTGSMRRQ